MTARQHRQLTSSAASGGARRTRRPSQPQPPPPPPPSPRGAASVFSNSPMQSFWPPAYPYQNNYQDFSPYAAYDYTYGFNYYYNWNHTLSVMRPQPRPRRSIGYLHQITISMIYGIVPMQPVDFVRVDETGILDGIGQETEDSMMLGDDVLSEEVISKYLKTRNGNHEDVDKDKDEEPKICVVCQDDLQESRTIGVLDCGHEFHARCIKKWLRRKNVCPLCKATAIVCR